MEILENKEEGDKFCQVKFPMSAHCGDKTCVRAGAGLCETGHRRRRGTYPAQQQPVIYVTPQPETLNIELKHLPTVWKQTLLCF